MNRGKQIREGSRLATGIMYVFSAFIVFITLYPMYYVLILSLSGPEAALRMDAYFWPRDFSLDAYKTLVKDGEMWRGLVNSVMYALTGTALMLFTSVIGAFPLTYKGLKGRKFINIFLLITMFFGGGMIPSFLLVVRLGMYDSPLALIIPGCFSVWNVILTKSYFSSIPETLREAAKIDGANVYQILLRVYLPLATPILAVLAVYTIVGSWNSWFGAMIYLPSKDWQPLQLFLRRLLVQVSPPAMDLQNISPEVAQELIRRQMAYSSFKYAVIIFVSLPVLFTYPFFQRYFMRGIMLGSLKE
jgi:putative aldouronate transport system permease protein